MYRIGRTTGRFVSVFLGVVLARSAFAHIANPYAFLDAILGYDILGRFPALIAASLIPPFQLCLAVLLVVGWWPRESPGIAALMFGVFVLAQCSALVRGLDVSCGCFGTASSVRIGASTIAFSTFCGVAALVARAGAAREARCVAV